MPNETLMEKPKIILFICNWGPHAAFQTLQDTDADIPVEVRMIRIPCTGRMSKSLLFKSFEMGADGVALVGCEAGSCRYGSGTESAERNVQDTQGILDLLGLGRDRLRLAMFLPEESQALLNFLQDFRDVIQTIGKSPVVVNPRDLSTLSPMETARVVAAHDVYACQDCGKCSSACPVTLSGKTFSPRAMANAIIGGDLESRPVVEDVWSCLTCGLCTDRCPSAVNFPDFIREMRHVLKCGGVDGQQSHGGFFQSLMRTMTSPNLPIRHWDWLPEDVKTDAKSPILYFGGCAPYFDTFFRHHLGVKTSDILVDSLRLLNFFDIFPNILSGERCCGHDLLWSGDEENFLRLARLNAETFEKMGIEEIVTSCPECFRTLSHDYPRAGVPLPVKVTHFYDLLEKEIGKGAVDFEETQQKITFQDPCRLSRLEGRPELPRRLLQRLRPQAFEEMQDRGVSALCCGNCAWTGCDSFTKALQNKRLRQARATGSDLLVTACPKCQIHLKCAMQDPFRGSEIELDIMDLTSLLAKTIKWA